MRRACVIAAVFLACPLAAGQADPSGIDFVTIGAPGNAPYADPNPNYPSNGRGQVNYEYRIGRTEVTTSQWCAFFSAAFDRPAGDRIPYLTPPTFWGAVSTTPNTPGGQRWRVPAGHEMDPVGNISWRMAAIFCNWECNNQGTDRSAFMSGAYDVSTFGWRFPGSNIFTDQPAHTPGARVWIPTWDEWLKASHYDPNKANPDGSVGGWWRYSNGTDTPYVYGPPGVLVNGVLAQANAGWDERAFPGYSPFAVPLGAYPNVTSPWGLLDTAGGSTEWTETIISPDPTFVGRVYLGSERADDPFQSMLADRIHDYGGEYPHVSSYEFGLRVASFVVPAPGACALGAGVLGILGARRKRKVVCLWVVGSSAPPARRSSG